LGWLNDPSYVVLRDHLVDRFRRSPYVFKSLRPVLFLCGGKSSPRRKRLADYFKSHHKNTLFFYAEDVWLEIAGRHPANALETEQQLAELADAVIIIVESEGTCAELGAFSSSESLRKKILPIVDRKYQFHDSFINTGPLRWVDQDSHYGPTIFTDLDPILGCIGDIEERLKKIPPRPIQKVEDVNTRPNYLLMLLCDLLAIIGPAPRTHCQWYFEKLLPGPPCWSLDTFLGLGVAMRIIKVLTTADEKYYYRPLENDTLVSFQHRRLFILAVERARFLNVLQRSSTAKRALDIMRKAG